MLARLPSSRLCLALAPLLLLVLLPPAAAAAPPPRASAAREAFERAAQRAGDDVRAWGLATCHAFVRAAGFAQVAGAAEARGLTCEDLAAADDLASLGLATRTDRVRFGDVRGELRASLARSAAREGETARAGVDEADGRDATASTPTPTPTPAFVAVNPLGGVGTATNTPFLNYIVSTLVGSGAEGFADGARTAALFNRPHALAPLPDGSVIVADTDNHCIRLVAAGGGSVSTLAGKGGEKGFADGLAVVARFYSPRGVVVAADGAIFVAEWGNDRVRRIKDGAVTTFAGSGWVGGADGVGAAASFNSPNGLALGPGSVLYVTEYFGDRVRMISPAGAVTTLAGDGRLGFADGRGTAARFSFPLGIAVDAAGIVFVADRDNNRIRRITNGVVDTLAGSGEKGFADGAGAAAQFMWPRDLALDPATGNLLVADSGNNRIRAIDPRSGAVSTVAGSGAVGAADGDAAAASFRFPDGIAVDALGGILVADTSSVRRISQALAPSPPPSSAPAPPPSRRRLAVGDRVRLAPTLRVASCLKGDQVSTIVLDDKSSKPFKLACGSWAIENDLVLASDESVPPTPSPTPAPTPATRTSAPRSPAVLSALTHLSLLATGRHLVVDTLAGSGAAGSADGERLAAMFKGPRGLTVLHDGSTVIADRENHCLRLVVAGSGTVTTLAGKCGEKGEADGPFAEARFAGPSGLVANDAGVIFVADGVNNRIRRAEGGVVSTFAGGEWEGGADGVGSAASFASIRTAKPPATHHSTTYLPSPLS